MNDYRPGHLGRALVAAARIGIHLSNTNTDTSRARMMTLFESSEASVKDLSWLILGTYEEDRAASQKLARQASLERPGNYRRQSRLLRDVGFRSRSLECWLPRISKQ